MSPVHYERDKLLAIGVCHNEKQVMLNKLWNSLSEM